MCIKYFTSRDHLLILECVKKIILYFNPIRIGYVFLPNFFTLHFLGETLYMLLKNKILRFY